MSSFQVLLVTKSDEVKQLANRILNGLFGQNLLLHSVDSLQDAIEKVEGKTIRPELILIEQRTSSLSMLKLFFDLCPSTASVVMCADGTILNDMLVLQAQARFIPLSLAETELAIAIKKFEAIGKIQKTPLTLSEDFITAEPARILCMRPLPIDVYLKVPSGKYVKVFRKGDDVLQGDIDKYSGQIFYLKRADCGSMLNEQIAEIEAVTTADPIDPVKAKKIADMSQELVRDLVSQVGFTEEAQKIAKSSVLMSLKLIGSKPRLASILTELKKKDGNFVTSHSFLLGQVACAMAYTVGWRSASTYFKLSMAAFLHDIALNIPTLEAEVTYEEAVASGNYLPDQLKLLRFHAIKASEYTRQFSEIPVDVEQIVAQHHERPNGSGYPRGLTAKYISPLSAIFILSHDLILFMMKFPDARVEKFYELVEAEFTQNPFRKLIAQLKNPAKINEVT